MKISEHHALCGNCGESDVGATIRRTLVIEEGEIGIEGWVVQED